MSRLCKREPVAEPAAAKPLLEKFGAIALERRPWRSASAWRPTILSKAIIAVALATTPLSALAAAAQEDPTRTVSPAPVHYRTVKADGLDIFYREAGDPKNPTILLLHGFPSSSHMYRDLIPLLSDRYHLVAPDYPGFGRSSQPTPAEYRYTFDHLYETVDQFTRAVGLGKFAIYIQDYGAPIGLRFALRQPERVTAIIVQNGNAYDVGLSPLWAPIKALWTQDTPETRKGAAAFLTRQTTTFQYSEGVPADRVNPDAIDNDQAILDRPGNQELQLDLFADYQTNLALYPAFHEAFRKHQFPTLIVWGKNDPIFTPAGAGAFEQDLPNAELHLLDAGHFALETQAAEISGYIREFLPRALK